MSEWHNHDVLGRKRRAVRMSMKETHAIVVERRNALVRDHATMTRAEAAERFGCSISTIAADEKALGIRCKPAGPSPRSPRARKPTYDQELREANDVAAIRKRVGW